MFERASRLKLRFETAKGTLSVEDLWDLPLSGNSLNLDKLAVALSRLLKEESVESFVVATKKADEVLQLKFDIVKHVIDVRMAEVAAAKEKADAKAKKARILEIIERKQDEALEGAPLDELQKMVADL